MISWLSHSWPYILIGVVCLLGAIWFTNRILESDPEGDDLVQSPVAATETVYVTVDAWRGFTKAHRENPPKWAENDSWSDKFIPR